MAMEIFKLVGSVFVDTDKAEKSLQKTDKQASNFGKTLVGGIGTAAKWAAGIAVAAGTAATALTTSAIKAYADYEQLVGGVETLMKESAGKVQAYAANAYKTAGLSANEYMETVTGFSAALIQSLGGDTEAAAEKANTAITDMSDNANKMGTTMESIQNAYQGFAKQNFGMLDNLKLGYGGTKQEMQRLLADAEKLSGQKFDLSSYADIVDAIHIIQTEMGITGTTAKEAASTISGSLGMMKSSWKNLLTAIASDELPFDEYVDNFVDSVGAVTDNLFPRIEVALGGVVKLVEKLAPKIIAKIPELLSSILPSVIGAADSLGQALVGALGSFISMIADLAPDLIAAFFSLFNTLVSQVPRLLADILEAIAVAVPSLVEGLVSGLSTIMEEIPNILEVLTTYIPWILEELATALLDNLPVLIDGLVDMLDGIIDYLPQFLQALIDLVVMLAEGIIQKLPEIIPALVSGIVSLVTSLCEQLDDILPVLINAVLLIVQLLIEELPALIPVLIDAVLQITYLLIDQLPIIIPLLIEAAITLILAIVEALPDILLPLIEALAKALPDVLRAIWDAVVMVFKNLPQWFGQLFQGAVDIIKGVFSAITEYFSGIRTGITGAFTGAISGVKNAWSGIKEWFRSILDGVKSVFSSAATAVGNVFKSPINTIIRGINSFIRGLNKIKIPDWVPAVGGKGFNISAIPELEKGGVLERGQVGFLEGNGAEAVVPLDKNKKWISAVARDMDTAMGGASSNRVEAILTDILGVLEDMASGGNGLDVNTLVRALVAILAKPMDKKLGQLQAAKARV